MITEINMYWLMRLDSIYNLFAIGLTAAIMALIFLIPFCTLAKLDKHESAGVLYKWTIAAAIIACVGVFGVIFVPTTKEMAAIYAIPAISRSELVQKDNPEIYDMGVQYIKTKLKAENEK